MNRLATFGKLLGVSTSYRKNEVLNTRTQPVAGRDLDYFAIADTP